MSATSRPGDLVVVDQGRNCVSHGRPLCEYCATGDSHQCAHYGEHGITGLPGALAEFVTVPAVNAIRVEPGSHARLALTEPLACIVHSCDLVERATTRYRLRPENPDHRVRTVLIFGGGPAGLLFTQYLRNGLGFDGQIVVSEPNALKRGFAERLRRHRRRPGGGRPGRGRGRAHRRPPRRVRHRCLGRRRGLRASCPRSFASRARSCSTGTATRAST